MPWEGDEEGSIFQRDGDRVPQSIQHQGGQSTPSPLLKQTNKNVNLAAAVLKEGLFRSFVSEVETKIRNDLKVH